MRCPSLLPYLERHSPLATRSPPRVPGMPTSIIAIRWKASTAPPQRHTPAVHPTNRTAADSYSARAASARSFPCESHLLCLGALSHSSDSTKPTRHIPPHSLIVHTMHKHGFQSTTVLSTPSLRIITRPSTYQVRCLVAVQVRGPRMARLSPGLGRTPSVHHGYLFDFPLSFIQGFFRPPGQIPCHFMFP